jgi:hypothetical protein
MRLSSSRQARAAITTRISSVSVSPAAPSKFFSELKMRTSASSFSSSAALSRLAHGTRRSKSW